MTKCTSAIFFCFHFLLPINERMYISTNRQNISSGKPKSELRLTKKARDIIAIA